MKIYGIAEVMSTGSSQGDPGIDIWVIREKGSYGTEGYPPFFVQKELAEDWITQIEFPAYRYKVIEFDLEGSLWIRLTETWGEEK